VTAYVVDQVAASRLAPIIDMARVKFEEDARLKNVCCRWKNNWLSAS
jgi:AmiR/NasT family two-component response regulator